MLICGDFEVFKEDWLAVFVDTLTGEETIIVNDRDKLVEYYTKNKKHVFCFYNGRHYDCWIMKGILLGLDPYDISKFIFNDNPGFSYDRRFHDIELLYYDSMFSKSHGLKKLEAFMGMNIHETSVPFDLDRKLTEEELSETIDYCVDDVYSMMAVMTESYNEFEVLWSMVKEFDLPISYLSKTKAQLTGLILDCDRVHGRNDEWDLRLPDYECKIKEKYNFVKEWFMDKANHDLSAELKCEVSGMEVKFGWGGIHGALSKYTLDENKRLEEWDVTSEYPSIMIQWGTLSRNVRVPEKFKTMYDDRIRLKNIGDTARQLPRKILLNTTYGASGDNDNVLYDPRQAHLTCLYGQLFLLDIMSCLEGHVKLVQSNTDAVAFEVDENTDYEKVKEIIEDWGRRTRMSMGPEIFDRVYQKDVNNYIMIDSEKLKTNPKKAVKCVGAYVKVNNPLDNDMPIVNDAVRNFFVYGTPPEETIMGCFDLIKFQKVYTRSNKYQECFHGTKLESTYAMRPSPKTGKMVRIKKTIVVDEGKKLSEKTFRIFAVTDESVGILYKAKVDEEGNKSFSKFQNCPDHALIWNESVKGLKTYDLDILDKNFYVDLAKKRIVHFGGKV